jgi:hypothetical protein
MARANPEPGVAYRKSQRSQMAAEQVAVNRARFEEEQRAQPTAAIEAAHAPAPAPASNIHLAPPAPTSTRASPRRAAARLAGETSTGAPAPKRSRVSRDSSAQQDEPADTDATATATADPSSETISVTLQSVTEIRAPTGTAIDAEAQIAESKALVMRVREEALARSRAGESAEDMGLVEPSSSSSSTIRGLKRTSEIAESETSGFVGGVAPTSSIVKSALKPTTEAARVIAGNRRIVNPEVAVRRQLAWGGLAFGAGVALTYLAGSFF